MRQLQFIILLLLFFGAIGNAAANEENFSEIFLNQERVPLSATELKSLKLSEDWQNSANYPYRDGPSVVFLHGVAPAGLVCAPFRHCSIELESGERIVRDGIQMGDLPRWNPQVVLGAQDTVQIFLKPLDAGLETTLSVVTDRRTYHIILKSHKQKYMTSVRFDYAEEIQYQISEQLMTKQEESQRSALPKTGESIQDLDFLYTWSECKKCDWRPLRVYNDGSRTIIQLPANIAQLEAPALLVIDEGEESIPNYRKRGDRYIVDNLFREAILFTGVGRKQRRVEIRWVGGAL